MALHYHVAVNHGAGEWARDDDGDGVSELHANTMEGTWTGLRNLLRPFRGVSKWHPADMWRSSSGPTT